MGWLIAGAVIWFFFASSKAKPKKRPNKPKSSYSKRLYSNSGPYKPTTRSYTPAYTPTQKPKARKKSSAPFYTGPLFAAPGTISTVFGYGSYESEIELPQQYAIIDLETSGLSPNNGRVIEIAIAVTDLNGKITNQFSSLINPGDGNVGRTDIHGISEYDISGAPTMEEISGNLLKMLQNSIVVAHNAKFEEKFLAMEFQKSNLDLPVLPALDTLWLSQIVLNLNDYKLNTVISHFGKEIENAHTALGDVLAVAQILPEMISLASPIKYPVPFGALPEISPSPSWKSRD